MTEYETRAWRLYDQRCEIAVAFRKAHEAGDTDVQENLLIELKVMDGLLKDIGQHLDPDSGIGTRIGNLRYLYRPDEIPDSPAEWTNPPPPEVQPPDDPNRGRSQEW